MMEASGEVSTKEQVKEIDVPAIFTLGIYGSIYIYIIDIEKYIRPNQMEFECYRNSSLCLFHFFQLGKLSSCDPMNRGNDRHGVMERLTRSPLSLYEWGVL